MQSISAPHVLMNPGNGKTAVCDCVASFHWEMSAEGDTITGSQSIGQSYTYITSILSLAPIFMLL